MNKEQITPEQETFWKEYNSYIRNDALWKHLDEAQIVMITAPLLPFLSKYGLSTPVENNLQEISDRAMQWRKEAFGERLFTAPLHHLKKEIQEVIEAEAEDHPHAGSLIEFADCLLLLLDAFCLCHPDLNTSDLLRAASNKIEINKKRKWGKPDEHGAYQHIEPNKLSTPVTDEVEAIVSDEEMNKAFANSNFGLPKRQVIKEALEKCTQGYHSGHTAKVIMLELGLTRSVTGGTQLTEKGLKYLLAAARKHSVTPVLSEERRILQEILTALSDADYIQIHRKSDMHKRIQELLYPKSNPKQQGEEVESDYLMCECGHTSFYHELRKLKCSECDCKAFHPTKNKNV